MAITTDTYTGWSDALSYNISSGAPTSDSSYSTLTGNLLERTWFDKYRVARKFTNVSAMYQQISKLTIEAHPCHSNNMMFSRSNNGSIQMISEGEGCTFAVDIYVPGEPVIANIASAKLDPISRFNCYYMGYGNTSLSDENTSFGSPTFFGPDLMEPGTATRADVDVNGYKRYRHQITFEFSNAPVLAQGDSMYLHIRPTDWTGINENCLIGMYTTGSYFTPVLHEVDAYIWRFTGTKWVKSNICYKYTGEDWQALGD